MFDLRKFFARSRHARDSLPGLRPDPDSSHSPGLPEGLEIEYQQLVGAQLRRSGICEACTTLEVRRLGRAPDGFEVFVGMLRLHDWERRSGLRLLLGLPMVERRVRRAVQGTWLADYSHFGGLWLHASEKLHATSAPHELRQLLQSLTCAPEPDSQPSSALPSAPHRQPTG